MPDQKPRGRPSRVKGEKSVPLSTRVSTGVYDRACVLAKRDRVSVSDVLRRGLSRVLRSDEDEDD